MHRMLVFIDTSRQGHDVNENDKIKKKARTCREGVDMGRVVGHLVGLPVGWLVGLLEG